MNRLNETDSVMFTFFSMLTGFTWPVFFFFFFFLFFFFFFFFFSFLFHFVFSHQSKKWKYTKGHNHEHNTPMPSIRVEWPTWYVQNSITFRGWGTANDKQNSTFAITKIRGQQKSTPSTKASFTRAKSPPTDLSEALDIKLRKKILTCLSKLTSARITVVNQLFKIYIIDN